MEQGFQHQNALHFDDTVNAAKILASNSPLEAFKLDKKVNMTDPKTWDKNRFPVMKNLLTLKFTQNVELKQCLLDTGIAAGMPLTNKNVCLSKKWKGNKLGIALMEVRATLSYS